ncbi:MAG: hypothetical protein JWP20_2664 [Roseomonas sp.]|jgi:hypothetical protein|nr:hypothetical protein [Roseomonas sp.]
MHRTTLLLAGLLATTGLAPPPALAQGVPAG